MALATLVIFPLFWRGLPCSDDTLPHFFRAVQLDVNLRQGAPFLQWGPDLLRGYGYPIFAFYAPLTYWLLEALHLLGADFGPALQIAFAGSLWLAGWGAYVLARRTLAPAGAFVAGLAYLFAPYVLYDAIPRGALPELLALALLPWALAAIDRAQIERVRTVLVAALVLALLILTHNVVSIFGLALALLLAVAGLPRPAGELWRALSPAVAAIVLALGLTAFFWLPGVAELRYTQSSRPDPPIAVWPRFEQHLVPPVSLLALPEDPADPALLNPPIIRALGVGQAALALLGLPALIAYRGAPPRRRQLLAWALVALVSLFFASTLSVWWWSRFEPLRFIQLPTRFLGPASLSAALLAGLGAQWLSEWGRSAAARSLLVALPALAVSLSGWPWLYPHYCPVPEAPTQATLAQATTWDRWYAEAQAELLPRWVDELPPEDDLIAAYQAGQPVNRLVLPATAALLDWESAPGWDRYELRLAAPETLLYRAFYFPGWQVRLDGERQPITIAAPHGLIAFDAPPGEHALTIAFERTPLRAITLVASGLFAVAFFALALASGAAVSQARQPAHRAPQSPAGSLPPIPFRALLFIALLLPLLKVGVVDRLDNPIRASRFDGSRLQGLAMPAGVDFGGELRYLGASAPAEVNSGSRFSLTGYWTALRLLGVPYGFDVRVAGDDGSVWNRPPERPFGYADYPVTFTWEPGEYARDAYEISLLPGTPPGDYWIEVSAFRRDTDLSLLPEGAASPADPAQARVGRLRVLPATEPVDASALDAQRAAVDVYNPVSLDGARLLGWSLPAIPIRAGEQIPLTLLWLAPPAPSGGGAFTLAPTGDDGAIIADQTFPYGPPSYPPEQWAPQTLVRQMLRWRIPPEIGSGAYTLLLDGTSLGTVDVDAPERTFAPPAVAESSDVAVGMARLAGFTVAPEAAAPGETITVTLSWQAASATETSYRVFLHLRDGSGAVRAQSDAVPAEWTRPTTGWLPGEYVLDRHAIILPADLPAGKYDLVAGLYDPATGERLGEAPLTAIAVR